MYAVTNVKWARNPVLYFWQDISRTYLRLNGVLYSNKSLPLLSAQTTSLVVPGATSGSVDKVGTSSQVAYRHCIYSCPIDFSPTDECVFLT